MLAADYARGLLLSRQRNAVEVSQFRLTAGKQICPGRQQWIVMINAEREAGRLDLIKVGVLLPSGRKAKAHSAFLLSMRLASATSPV
jgi:hypothetical protein